MDTREKLIKRAQEALRESKQIEFKREFDTGSAASWCEIIKDIVALANSGGGIIVFGVNDGGALSDQNVEHVGQIDTADISNRISKYTNYEFSDFDLIDVRRHSRTLPSIIVFRSDVPIVFTKPGTYDIGNGRQKTAFSQGTVYFRHGSKSEPGTHDDLVKWRDQEIGRVRRSWFSGIRKVVETPAGHTVTVIPTRSPATIGSAIINAKFSDDPSAIGVVPRNAEEIFPHRQKDLVAEINRKLPEEVKINGHDIYCINKHYEILQKQPQFAYKPHKLSSPQYSPEFVAWIVGQYKRDKKFFEKCRAEMKKNAAAQ
jgi:hypothetical protein